MEFENATITYTREKPVFHGVMADGRPLITSGVAPGGDMQKLMDAIRRLSPVSRHICGVEADLPHIHAVRLVQQNPITPVRSELVRAGGVGGGCFYFVKNLEQMLVHCAETPGIAQRAGD